MFEYESYEIIGTIIMIILLIIVLSIGGIAIYGKINNSPEKIKRKYIDEGYKGAIVII